MVAGGVKEVDQNIGTAGTRGGTSEGHTWYVYCINCHKYVVIPYNVVAGADDDDSVLEEPFGLHKQCMHLLNITIVAWPQYSY